MLGRATNFAVKLFQNPAIPVNRRALSTKKYIHHNTMIRPMSTNEHKPHSNNLSTVAQPNQSMEMIRNLLVDAQKAVNSAAEVIANNQKRQSNARTLDDTSKRSVVINTLVTDDKFKDVYKSYSKVMSQSKDYSVEVDRVLCSKGTLITRPVSDGSDLGKVDHLNIVDGNGESWLPITGLPTEIDWANNDRRIYENLRS